MPANFKADLRRVLIETHWQAEFNRRAAMVVSDNFLEHFAHELDPMNLKVEFDVLEIESFEDQTYNGDEFTVTVTGPCTCGQELREIEHGYANSLGYFMNRLFDVEL